jgi:hypothetical protein
MTMTVIICKCFSNLIDKNLQSNVINADVQELGTFNCLFQISSTRGIRDLCFSNLFKMYLIYSSNYKANFKRKIIFLKGNKCSSLPISELGQRLLHGMA